MLIEFLDCYLCKFLIVCAAVISEGKKHSFRCCFVGHNGEPIPAGGCRIKG